MIVQRFFKRFHLTNVTDEITHGNKPFILSDKMSPKQVTKTKYKFI